MSQNAKISSSTFAVTTDITQIDGLAGFKTGTPNSNIKISGNDLVSSLETEMDLNSISGGPLTIANGGTGHNNAQDAIDALTNASSGTSGFVLTTDGTGVAWESVPTQMIAANKMTSTSFGVAKIYSNVQPLASETEEISTMQDRTYGVQLNSNDQLVVNVPWIDTDVGPVESVTLGTSGTSTGNALSISPNTGTGAVVITANSFNGGSNVGYVPDASAAAANSFLTKDGSWEVPPNSTYQLNALTASNGKITLTNLPSTNAGEVSLSGSGGITVTTPTAGNININGPVANDNITVLLDQNTNLANTQNDTTYVVPFNQLPGNILNTNPNLFSATLNTSSNPNLWNAYVQASKEGNSGVFLVHGGYHSFDGQNTNAQMDLWVEWTTGSAPQTLGITSWPSGARNLVNIGSGFVSTTANGNAGQVGSCVIDTGENEGPIYFRILFRHSSFIGGSGYPVDGGINIGGVTVEGYIPFITVTLIK